MSSILPLKKCSKCSVEYPATLEYFPWRKNRGAYDSWCKQCRRNAANTKYEAKRDDPEYRDYKRQRARIWRDTNIEYARERERLRARTPERQEQKRKQGQKRRENGEYKRASRERRQNPEYREKQRIYLAAYGKTPEHRAKEKLRRNTAQYRTVKQLSHGRRAARQRLLPDQFTSNDMQRMMEYWEGCCAICGKHADFWTAIAFDHWIPLSSPDCPGTISTNIVPMCHAKKGVPSGESCCNNSKGNKEAHAWLVERFGKREAARIEKRIYTYFEWIKAIY